MSILFNSFTQPASAGQSVTVQLIGDPFPQYLETVRFIKYGEYQVQGVSLGTQVVKSVDLMLTGKYFPEISTVPAGTVMQVEKEGVTHSEMAYSSVRYLSFREDDYRTLLLSGDITFATQHHAPAKSITVRMRNLSGTLNRNLSFPSSWIFLGTAGRPSAIAPSRTGVLSITCFGTSDAEVIAAWAVQA